MRRFRQLPRQPAHLHTQTESGAYLRDFSRVPRRRPFIYLNRHTPSTQSRVCRVTQLRTDGVHCLPPRIRRHRASKPQDSSKLCCSDVDPIPDIIHYVHPFLLFCYISDEIHTTTYQGTIYYWGSLFCSKKNLNASRPSEHPPVRGGNVKTFRWDHRL